MLQSFGGCGGKLVGSVQMARALRVLADFQARGLEPERCGSPFLFDRVKKLPGCAREEEVEVHRLPARPTLRP